MTKPEFQAVPLTEAATEHLPVTYQIVPGHHYAFIAPFPDHLVNEVPVAQDPIGLDRMEFLNSVNQMILSAFTDD